MEERPAEERPGNVAPDHEPQVGTDPHGSIEDTVHKTQVAPDPAKVAEAERAARQRVQDEATAPARTEDHGGRHAG